MRSAPAALHDVQNAVDLRLHRKAVLRIQVLPAGHPAELLQHLEVIGKVIHAVVGVRDPGRDQRLVQIDMLGGVGGKDQEIRVSRKDRLKFGCFTLPRSATSAPSSMPRSSTASLVAPISVPPASVHVSAKLP